MGSCSRRRLGHRKLDVIERVVFGRDEPRADFAVAEVRVQFRQPTQAARVFGLSLGHPADPAADSQDKNTGIPGTDTSEPGIIPSYATKNPLNGCLSTKHSSIDCVPCTARNEIAQLYRTETVPVSSLQRKSSCPNPFRTVFFWLPVCYSSSSSCRRVSANSPVSAEPSAISLRPDSPCPRLAPSWH